MNLGKIAEGKRSWIDRRSGEDIRKVYSFDYFLRGGIERRKNIERRKGNERRNSWIRVSNWSSALEWKAA